MLGILGMGIFGDSLYWNVGGKSRFLIYDAGTMMLLQYNLSLGVEKKQKAKKKNE